MATFEDSFSGIAGTYLDARYPTRISDNTDILLARWRAYAGQIARLSASGGAAFDFNPLGACAAPFLAITAKQATVVAIVEATHAQLGDNSIAVGSSVNDETGIGYYLEVGNFGFGGITARLIDGANLLNMAGGVSQLGALNDGNTSLNGLKNFPLSIKLDCQIEGNRHRLIASYQSNGGAWTVLINDLVAAGFEAPAGGYPAMNLAGYGNSGRMLNFKATYDPAAIPPLLGARAKVVVLGDSNSQYRSAALGRRTIPHAVGVALRADGYAAVDVYNMSISGSTVHEWAAQTGSQVAYCKHAAAVAAFEGIKAAYIPLGTNSAKDSVAASAADYKTDMQVIIAELQAAGVQRVALVDPAYVRPNASDFSGANARIQTYGLANQELAVGGVSRVPGLYPFFATNNGPAYLPDDGIHYYNTTQGALAARNIIHDGVVQAVLEAYPLAPKITTQPVSKALGEGATLNLFVLSTGVGDLIYQWYKDGLAIANAAANAFSKPGIGYGDAGSYTVSVTNEGGTTLSDAAVVTVDESVGPTLASAAVDISGVYTLVTLIETESLPIVLGNPHGLSVLLDGTDAVAINTVQLTGPLQLRIDHAQIYAERSVVVRVNGAVTAITDSANPPNKAQTGQVVATNDSNLSLVESVTVAAERMTVNAGEKINLWARTSRNGGQKANLPVVFRTVDGPGDDPVSGGSDQTNEAVWTAPLVNAETSVTLEAASLVPGFEYVKGSVDIQVVASGSVAPANAPTTELGRGYVDQPQRLTAGNGPVNIAYYADTYLPKGATATLLMCRDGDEHSFAGAVVYGPSGLIEVLVNEVPDAGDYQAQFVVGGVAYPQGYPIRLTIAPSLETV